MHEMTQEQKDGDQEIKDYVTGQKPPPTTPGYSYQPPPQRKCPNGHPNSKTAMFCPTCGAAMPEPTVTQDQEIKDVMCRNGHWNSKDAVLCTAPGCSEQLRAGDIPLVNNTKLPTVATTIVITFLFGLFGLIPATMHTSRARAAGRRGPQLLPIHGGTGIRRRPDAGKQHREQHRDQLERRQ